MGKQRRSPQHNSAAKKQRRTKRVTKSADSPSAAPRVQLTVPIWEYRAAARLLAERLPEMTTADALDYLLTEPVRWQADSGLVSSIIPADVVALTGESVETYIASMNVLHDLGQLAWDAKRRVHIQTFPDSDPLVP